MTSVAAKYRFKVGVLIFQGVDLLDFTGPLEIFSLALNNKNPDNPDRVFDVVTISRDQTIRAGKGYVSINADVLLEDIGPVLPGLDILVVPGGPPSTMKALLRPSSPELGLIRDFITLSRPADVSPRTIFSVCTGALLLGASGFLSGMTVTTHHRELESLRQICESTNTKSNSVPVNVIKQRYVDGGLVKCGGNVRLITSGAISSGLDAALYLVSELTSQEMAEFATRVMQYEWNRV
ncbi:hypothetical protein N7513_006176 [Penicillium frequentans]|nr:hypothetical protein N7513_006176 [Penicillium glabrum]